MNGIKSQCAVQKGGAVKTSRPSPRPEEAANPSVPRPRSARRPPPKRMPNAAEVVQAELTCALSEGVLSDHDLAIAADRVRGGAAASQVLSDLLGRADALRSLHCGRGGKT
jgi:hypothetical protein